MLEIKFVKNFRLNICGILWFLCSIVFASDWKPIVPPHTNYYSILPNGQEDKYPLQHDLPAGKLEVDQINNDWSERVFSSNHRTQTAAGKKNRNKDLVFNNPKLDLEIYKPKKVSFFPTDLEEKESLNAPLLTYQDVYKKTPNDFFSLKTASGKPIKTAVHYGDPALLSENVKFATGHNPRSDYKILIQPFRGKGLKPYHYFNENPYDDQCPVYKVSFRQEFFNQYVQYRVRMPDLIEFTICVWFKFHNYSYEQSLLSYAAKPLGKDIYMWVSNLNKPGLFNMKVLGQTIFRLNYPFKLHKWYHTCQSWNGKTGEWQVWVDGHRIGRGFHNSLVGHKIPGKGIAISGQVQRHFGKEFQNVPHFIRATGGLEGEITMLQMYKVALTAGKAYNDHRHHHSHHTTTTTESPEIEEETQPPSSEHPLLENGQLKPHVNILELVKALKSKNFLDTFENQQNFDELTKHHMPFSYQSHYSPFASYGNPINYAVLSHPWDIADHSVFKRNDASIYSDRKFREEKKNQKNQTSDALKEETEAEEMREQPKTITVMNKTSRRVRVQKIKFPNLQDQSTRAEKTESNTKEDNSLKNQTANNVKRNDLLKNDSKLTEDECESKKVESDKSSRERRMKRDQPNKIIILSGPPKPRTTGDIKLVRNTVRTRGRDSHVSIPKSALENKKRKTSKRNSIGADDHYYSNLGTLNVAGYSHYGNLPPAYANHFYEFLPQHEEDYEKGIFGESDHRGEDETSFPETGEVKKEIELAEDEVRRVMLMCSGCQPDPYRKVAVISWRSTPKKFFSGTLFLKANPECENF